MVNWYVMQVMSGHEDKIKEQCKLLLNEHCYEECFVPKRKRLMKIKGSWKEIEEVLFKGYVFMITDDPDHLALELRNIMEMTKLLGKSEHEFFPLYESEVNFLKSFGKNEHVVEMSTGIIEGDNIVIMEGPLVGHEGSIKHIDRHKRIATIEVDFIGHKTEVKVGLEIITKR